MGWHGEDHRLQAPHRSGRARAPQALASALAHVEVDGAVLLWCSLLPGSARSVVSVGRGVVVTLGFLHPSATVKPGTGSEAG